LGTRNKIKEGNPYEWKTFREIDELQENFAQGMWTLGLCPDQEAEGQKWTLLGVFAKNREEWAVVDLACMRSSVTIVPFFDSLGADALAFVLNQTEVSTMCVEDASIDALLKVKTKCPHLKNIVVFDFIKEEQRQKADELGLSVIEYSAVIEEGKKHHHFEFNEPTPDTIYIFGYTSGTTGDPKGAKLSHKAFVSNMKLFDYFHAGFTPDDVSISYLPYAHLFEQCVFVYSLFRGFSHGYYSGNPAKVPEDLMVLKPTFFVTVPRILNRIYQKIME
jgi:long-chain acyl-CoA synthetase